MKVFTKEEFKFIRDVYDKAFLSDSFNQLCAFCEWNGKVCYNFYCGNIKRLMDLILDNWRE